MKKKNFIKKLIKNNRASWVTIAGIIMIFLLSASCASQYNKQALPEKGGSEIVKGGGDQEIECRWKRLTGSNLREKFCATKAAWEKIDQGQKRDADQFMDDVVDEMRQNRNAFEDDTAVPF